MIVYALRARRAGAHYAYRIMKAAARHGIQPSLAFALVEQESGFDNVFGHDPTIFAGAGKVTKRKYLAYRQRRGPGGRGGMQGVGLTQLTWWEVQDKADREGGCWRPKCQLDVGLATLRSNIEAHGKVAGIAAYNGTGPAADAYAQSVLSKARRWHNVLVGR